MLFIKLIQARRYEARVATKVWRFRHPESLWLPKREDHPVHDHVKRAMWLTDDETVGDGTFGE